MQEGTHQLYGGPTHPPPFPQLPGPPTSTQELLTNALSQNGAPLVASTLWFHHIPDLRHRQKTAVNFLSHRPSKQTQLPGPYPLQAETASGTPGGLLVPINSSAQARGAHVTLAPHPQRGQALTGMDAPSGPRSSLALWAASSNRTLVSFPKLWEAQGQ